MSAPAHLVPVPAGRVPPQALDAERSLLGGLLLVTGQDKNAELDDLLDLVGIGDFYREANRSIFGAMLDLHAKGEPVDRVTVKKALLEQGALETVGGEQYIDLLDTVTPSASNLAIYARDIRGTALRRRGIEAAHAISSLGYSNLGTPEEFLDEAERCILSVTEKKQARAGLEPARQILRATFAEIQRDAARGDVVTGLATGLDDLDLMTAGLQPGDAIVLAARPSDGKTALGLGIAAHVTMRGRQNQGKRAAAFFSMEMPKIQIMKRLLSHESRVDMQSIRTGQFSRTDEAKMGNASVFIGEAPLEIDDEKTLSVLDIRSRLRRVAKKYANSDTPLGLAVIDFLTLMKHEAGDAREDIKIGNDMKRLKEIGGELGIPMLILAQLNRDSVKGGKPRKPGLHDLKESGDIEAAADVAIFIFHHDEEGPLLLVEKQRNGPKGQIRVDWRPECVRFDNKSTGPHRHRNRDFTEPAERGERE